MKLQTSDSKQYISWNFILQESGKKQKNEKNQDMKKQSEQPHVQTLKTRSDFICIV